MKEVALPPCVRFACRAQSSSSATSLLFENFAGCSMTKPRFRVHRRAFQCLRARSLAFSTSLQVRDAGNAHPMSPERHFVSHLQIREHMEKSECMNGFSRSSFSWQHTFSSPKPLASILWTADYLFPSGVGAQGTFSQPSFKRQGNECHSINPRPSRGPKNVRREA